jgi:hypothetical protein
VGDAEQPEQEFHHVVAAVNRMWHAGALVTTVAVEGGVAGEQRDEPVDVAVLTSGEKSMRQCGLFLARDFEAKFSAFDPVTGSLRELSAVRLTLADDPRSPRNRKQIPPASGTPLARGERAFSSMIRKAMVSDSAISATSVA